MTEPDHFNVSMLPKTNFITFPDYVSVLMPPFKMVKTEDNSAKSNKIEQKEGKNAAEEERVNKFPVTLYFKNPVPSLQAQFVF